MIPAGSYYPKIRIDALNSLYTALNTNAAANNFIIIIFSFPYSSKDSGRIFNPAGSCQSYWCRSIKADSANGHPWPEAMQIPQAPGQCHAAGSGSFVFGRHVKTGMLYGLFIGMYSPVVSSNHTLNIMDKFLGNADLSPPWFLIHVLTMPYIFV